VTSVKAAEAVSLACCSRGRYGKCHCSCIRQAGGLLLRDRACPHHVRGGKYSESSGVDYADLHAARNEGMVLLVAGHVLKARKDGAWCLQVLARRLRLRLL
jgi:hypothetical protein